MKRVFHIVPNRWTSGLEKIVMNICMLVPGYDFTYIVPHGSIEQDLRDRNIHCIGVDNITPMSIRKLINQYHPDIVHGHDVKASLCLALNYKICKKNNIQIISELHNDDFRMHKISIRSLLYKISTKYYDDIVLVSKRILDNYIFKNCIKDKARVIDNVINPNIIDKVNKNVQSSDFIFLGRLEPQKNPKKFVEFIKKIKNDNPNVKSFMIGKGSLRDDVVKLIDQYRLEDNIKLLGYKSNPYPYVANTKAVVITSRYEGLCLVALESLMLSKPVITTDISGVQFVDDSCGTKSNSLNSLVKFGNKILNNPDFCDRESENAYEKSKLVNKVDEFIKKYKSLYN